MLFQPCFAMIERGQIGGEAFGQSGQIVDLNLMLARRRPEREQAFLGALQRVRVVIGIGDRLLDQPLRLGQMIERLAQMGSGVVARSANRRSSVSSSAVGSNAVACSAASAAVWAWPRLSIAPSSASTSGPTISGISSRRRSSRRSTPDRSGSGS